MTTLLILTTLLAGGLLFGIITTVTDIKNWFPYVIKKGKHYASSNLLLRFIPYFKDVIRFEVIFTESCIYKHTPESDQLDINKLYGFWWGLKGAKYNSIRVGWRWSIEKRKIELFLYVHDNSNNFQYFLIKEIEISDKVKFNVFIFNDDKLRQGKSRLVISGDGFYQTINFNQKIPKLKFRSLPYFGGNQIAQDDVKILIREI